MLRITTDPNSVFYVADEYPSYFTKILSSCQCPSEFMFWWGMPISIQYHWGPIRIHIVVATEPLPSQFVRCCMPILSMGQCPPKFKTMVVAWYTSGITVMILWVHTHRKSIWCCSGAKKPAMDWWMVHTDPKPIFRSWETIPSSFSFLISYVLILDRA